MRVLRTGSGSVNYGLVGNVSPLIALNTTGSTVTFNANAIATQMTISANSLVTAGVNGMISAMLA